MNLCIFILRMCFLFSRAGSAKIRRTGNHIKDDFMNYERRRHTNTDRMEGHKRNKKTGETLGLCTITTICFILIMPFGVSNQYAYAFNMKNPDEFRDAHFWLIHYIRCSGFSSPFFAFFYHFSVFFLFHAAFVFFCALRFDIAALVAMHVIQFTMQWIFALIEDHELGGPQQISLALQT